MIAIIDYGAGNLRSVLSAFRRLNESRPDHGGGRGDRPPRTA